jgi:hypothetical protein
VNNITTGSPGVETISQSTLTQETFNFSQQGLIPTLIYRDQEVQTLSDFTSRTITSGPRTILREVIVDQNIRMTHFERSYNMREIRDSQTSLIEKAVQTDLNPMIHTANDSIVFHDYVEKSQQLADFVGL